MIKFYCIDGLSDYKISLGPYGGRNKLNKGFKENNKE